MLLALDAGNTQSHIGVFSGAALVAQWRISTDPDRSADELAALISGLLSFGGISFPSDLTGFVVGSVVPNVTAAARELAAEFFDFTPVVVGPGIKTGISVSTDNPKEVGADRVANALAAYEITGGPAIVVDFGTATTFDTVTRRGEYLGGAICPGIQISVGALAAAAAQLSEVDLTPPRSAIGRNTADSIRSGVVLGTACMVDGMVERLDEELGGGAEVLATGGLAPIVIAQCRTAVSYDPDLTLTGLRLLYERNSGEAA